MNYIELDEKADFYVIVIDIPTEPDRNRPYVYDGRPYYRIESTTSLMPQSMYQELLLQRDIRKRKWEEEIDTKVSVDSLDEESVRRLVSSGIQAGRIPESMRIKSIPEILDKMKLSENGHIKNAAVALFTKEDYAPIQLHIRLARFKGVVKGSTTQDVYQAYLELMSPIQDKMHKMVEQRTKGTVEFKTEVNPELIGGFILEYGIWRSALTKHASSNLIYRHSLHIEIITYLLRSDFRHLRFFH